MKEPSLKVTCPTIEEELSVRVSVVPASVLRKVNDADKPFIVVTSQMRYPISSVRAPEYYYIIEAFFCDFN